MTLAEYFLVGLVPKVIGVLRTPPPVELDKRCVERAPRNQPALRLRLGVVTRVDAPDIGVSARGEAQVRAVIPRVARAGKLQIQPPPCTVQFREISKSIPRAVQISIDLRVVEGPPRVCTEQLEREEGVAVQTQASVNAREMIVLLDEIGAGRDQSDARLIADVAPDAQNSGVSVVVDEPGDCRELRRIGSLVFAEIARSVVARQQRAEIRAAAFAGQLQRHVGVDDRPRMERPNGRAEDVSAFEEKGPPLF